ncbi:hypothetical protein G6009_00945 [Dietzia sp. SLG510A3-30A2]|nr:hypothetical protein [Dietzia sp. SLG510A3-30A2]
MSEPYAPTTEDVKQRWLEAHRVPASLGSEQIGHLRQQRLAEFDAWLAKVKADAWDEGWEACHAFMGRGIFPPRTNPYREPVDGAEGDGRADQ